MEQGTEPTRRCGRCGETKPIRTGFYRQPRKRSKCRACHQAQIAESRRERGDFITAYKMDHGCMDCGWREHVAALELDHRPGEVKLIEGNELRVRGTWQEMLDELAKCDVVCANCHRIRTHSRPPAMFLHDLRTKPDPLPYRPHDPDQLGLFDEAG